MTVQRSADGTYPGLACDKCARSAPGVQELIERRGLVNMGWFCSGGQHICPDCPRPEVVERVHASPNL